jgi:hypothetical protein
MRGWPARLRVEQHRPSSTRRQRRVQPSSGARAQPSARPMVQLCSGQATLSPKTMPWLSGPPLCGQRSSSANTRSSAVRNTATAMPLARATRRAPSTGMSSTRQTAVQSGRCSAVVSVAVVPGGLRPRLLQACSALELPQSTFALSNSNQGSGSPSRLNCSCAHSALRPSASSRIFALHVVQPDAVHVVHGALQVPALLAVELQKAPVYSSTSSASSACTKNCATSVLMPPLPAT